MKVLIVTNILAPYRKELFEELNNSKYDINVLALSEKEENREWETYKEDLGFKMDVVPGIHKYIWSREIPLHLNIPIVEYIERIEPDVIITSGYNNISYWEGLLYARAKNIKFIMWCGTTLDTIGIDNKIIESIKRIFVNYADSYITYGTRATKYLQRLGAERENIYQGCNTINMDRFRKRVNTIEKSSEGKLKYLFVGQLIERKGVVELLKSWPKNINKTKLTILGKGPKQNILKKIKYEKNMSNVNIEGYVERSSIHRYYAQSDVLILPSKKEVWGLVVNEALAAGLYVLCSFRAGAYPDLIKDTMFGIGIDPTSIKDMKNKIKQCFHKKSYIRNNKDRRSIIACRKYSINKHTEAFVNSFTSVQ